MFLSAGSSQIILVIVGIFLILLLFVVVWFISVRNSFARMLVDIDNSESRIDVYLTKRYDLLTKMLSSTKGYAKHEKDTLEGIVSLRNPGNAASIKDKANFDSMMTSATEKLNIVVEKYPDLKADGVFMNLQNAIAEVEENLQAARSNYNSNVAIYNKKIVVFPNSIVAGAKFTRREFFEADIEKKSDVEMIF